MKEGQIIHLTNDRLIYRTRPMLPFLHLMLWHTENKKQMNSLFSKMLLLFHRLKSLQNVSQARDKRFFWVTECPMIQLLTWL